MNSNDAPEKPDNQDEENARKAAADALRRQIESLKAGRKPRTFNEFAEGKVAEDRANEKHQS